MDDHTETMSLLQQIIQYIYWSPGITVMLMLVLAVSIAMNGLLTIRMFRLYERYCETLNLYYELFHSIERELSQSNAENRRHHPTK